MQSTNVNNLNLRSDSIIVCQC